MVLRDVGRLQLKFRENRSGHFNYDRLSLGRNYRKVGRRVKIPRKRTIPRFTYSSDPPPGSIRLCLGLLAGRFLFDMPMSTRSNGPLSARSA